MALTVEQWIKKHHLLWLRYVHLCGNYRNLKKQYDRAQRSWEQAQAARASIDAITGCIFPEFTPELLDGKEYEEYPDRE